MALTYFILGCIFAAFVAGETCNNPQVVSQIYTTTDATIVSDIGFIAEFSLSCTNNAKNVNLYAEVNGRTMSVIKAPNGDRYQVSWSSDPKEVRYYQYPVKVYDENGYSALRKAQRLGDDTSAIQPLFTIDVTHKGTSTGPWFHSEFLAAIVAICVWYFAYANKSKLMQ
ncbi:hypothetical protein CHUAL_013358 [Chamberlinius hualienensis]